jgi:hypothetical protein
VDAGSLFTRTGTSGVGSVGYCELGGCFTKPIIRENSAMSDPVLASYLKEFKTSYDLQSLDDSRLFEYFSAYCVFFRDFSEYTQLEDVIVAGTQDSAIDAIGIFLNDLPVETTAQVDDISAKTRIDTDFAFIQAKTSRNLSAAEIGSFLQGVREFFSEQRMPVNEDISRKRLISDHIFSQGVKMRSKPFLHLYYCYTGKFQSDLTILARVDAAKADLKRLNLFSQIEFTFLDADALQGRYQEVNLRVEKEIQISEYASLPTISGIRQSYLGVLSCKELVRLLSNADGKLQKSLFNENVRDFLGRNPVNDEIEKTIKSKADQSRLAALNNGITIVARDIRIIGKKFTLSDFQIVNGCQTSHVIFANRDRLLADTSIPVKMIEATDRELINEIVRATNSQTEVKDEAFVVLGEFHKKIERFFASIDVAPDRKLVYERRKRQYADSAFTAKNIVTLTFLTTSFVSCFIENPVDAVDYYGVLLRRYAGGIFAEDHSIWPYFVSATILRAIESLCTGKVQVPVWKFRFILALLVRRSHGKSPRLNDDKGQQIYAESIIRSCHDRKDFLSRLTEAERKIADLINAQGHGFDNRNAQQDRKFVDQLLRSS